MPTRTSTIVFLLFTTTWSSLFAELTEEVNLFSKFRAVRRQEEFNNNEPTPPCQMLQVQGNAADQTRGQFQFETRIIGKDTSCQITRSIKQMLSLIVPVEWQGNTAGYGSVTSDDGKSKVLYRLEGSHTEGTQGVIYFGRFENPYGKDRPVAIKVPKDSDIPEARRETEFYQKLMPCEGILELIQFGNMTISGSEADTFALVMEPMAADLEFLLGASGGMFSKDAAIQIMRELLVAFRHMHSLGVVHRDIKPGNLMTPMPVPGKKKLSVKIIDFGLAQNYTLTNTNETCTVDYNWIGTIVTMSSLPWEKYCVDMHSDHKAAGSPNYIPQSLFSKMEYLCDMKEEYLKGFVLEVDNRDFKKLVEYIGNLGPNSIPDYDFLQQEVELIALNGNLGSSTMDWINVANKCFGGRDVISVAILNLDVPEVPKPIFRYIMEPFYASLYNIFKTYQRNLTQLDELSAMALQLLKCTTEGTTSEIFVSNNIPLDQIQNISFANFTEESRVTMEQAVRRAVYVGFAYTFDEEQGTIRIGVVLQNVNTLWGMESLVKMAVEKEAAMVNYPALTIREKGDEEEKNEGYKEIFYDVDVHEVQPFGSAYVAFTKLRFEYISSLTKSEFREITYTYKYKPTTGPQDPPTVRYTFTFKKQVALRNFLESIRLAYDNAEENYFTWSMDSIEWEAELTVASSSTTVTMPFEAKTQVTNLQENTFELLETGCVSLDPFKSKALPISKAKEVHDFLVAGNGNNNVRLKWKKDQSGNYVFVFKRDTFYAELAEDVDVSVGGSEGSQTGGTSGKYNRIALRQWANNEADQMKTMPNQAVSVEEEDGYILLKTSLSGDKKSVESTIHATIATLKGSLNMLSAKQKSEIVSFAYGYAISQNGTVNGVVLCQLYFFDVYKMLRNLPTEYGEPIQLQNLLQIEAEKAFGEPSAYPDAVLSTELSHEQLCNLGAEHFPALEAYLAKAALYEVGFAMRYVKGKYQVAIAFQSLS